LARIRQFALGIKTIAILSRGAAGDAGGAIGSMQMLGRLFPCEKEDQLEKEKGPHALSACSPF
jgi:hypothetical protein